MRARARDRRSRRWRLRYLRSRRRNRLEQTETTNRTDPTSPGAVGGDSSASDDELNFIRAPSIDGPAGGGLAWPSTPQVRFRVVAKQWADIHRMLRNGEYVDAERLEIALITHRSEPVEPTVLPYLCAFLLGRASQHRGRKPKSST
jgi:hypothetical protein